MGLFMGFDDAGSAALLLVLLGGAAGLGHVILPRLPEHHRSPQTLDTVRLVSSLSVTFAALVLGLLSASVNGAFNAAENDVNALAGSIRQTDNCLKSYGDETLPLRRLLRAYTAGAIASTWPEEPLPAGDYPREDRASQSFESLALGDVLERTRMGILRLMTADPARQALAAVCAASFTKLSDDRWKLIGEAHRSISVPFYRVLVLMLTTVFISFGLNAPRNALALLSLAIAAVTIAVSVFVMLELDGPLDGLIKVPSAALRETLGHFDG